MNLSVQPAFDAKAARARSAGKPPHAVYADLTELMKLEFKASGFSFLPRQPVHSILAGRHASRLRGRGLNFEEIRRYLPGDDIRSIDWRATARLNKPHVRVYSEERDRPCLLVVDQRSSMFFGSRRMMKSVAAAEAAALTAWRVFHSGDRIGAIVFNDRDFTELRPHRSRRQVMQVLQAVVDMNHALRADNSPSNPGMFQEAMDHALRLVKHDALVVIITDGLGIPEKAKRPGTLLAAHNDLVVGFIYDPMEAEMPAAGRLVFGRGDQQLEVDATRRKLRQEFADDFLQRKTALENLARQHKTPLLSISTESEVADQIRAVLGGGR